MFEGEKYYINGDEDKEVGVHGVGAAMSNDMLYSAL